MSGSSCLFWTISTREYELSTSGKLCWNRLIKFRELNRHWDKLPARKRYRFNALIRRAISKLVTNSFPFFLPQFNKPSDFAACNINPGRDRLPIRSWFSSIFPHPFRSFTLAIHILKKSSLFKSCKFISIITVIIITVNNNNNLFV